MAGATFRIAGLYAIADSSLLAADVLVSAAGAALRGGAQVLQYRDKHNGAAQRTATARALQELCHQYEVPLIINDDFLLAATVGAAGVHLGRDDADISTARAALGENAVIGLSCYNQLQRALAAQAAGADYVAFGSFFSSRTKPQAVPATLELLHTARAALKIPIVAIGGITAENGATLIEAGADALAVIDAVFNQADIRSSAERFARLFNNDQRQLS